MSRRLVATCGSSKTSWAVCTGPTGKPAASSFSLAAAFVCSRNQALMISPSQPDMLAARAGPDVAPSRPTSSGRSMAAQNFAQSPSVATMMPT